MMFKKKANSDIENIDEIQDTFNDDMTIFEDAENIEEVDSDDNKNQETE